MRKLILFSIAIFCLLKTQAQNVGIGTTSPKASAALEITSTDKGLLIPRTSTTGRTGIVAPAKGLMVYDTTHSAFFYFDGGTWRPLYEKNYDSATVDHSSTAFYGINLPGTIGGYNYISPQPGDYSGFIYDNGGPAGNYNANSSSSTVISFNLNTILVKLTIEEMQAETFYDSLYIIQYNEATSFYTDTIAKYTGTQTGTVYLNNSAVIHFKSNSINQFAGFKIRWGAIISSQALQNPPPLYGWHFDNDKLAAMGGLQRLNNWHTDSVGYGSISYGIDNKAIGNSSVAMGYNTTANNAGTTAFGYQTTASGFGSTAFGYQTKANRSYSTAMGYETIANSYRATAMGSNTYATGFSSFVAGIYNDSILNRQEDITNETPLLIIGNGNAHNDRSNALVVLKNGNVAIGNNGSPVNRLHITGGSDLDLTDNSGFITLGGVGGGNMVLDDNEIQARDNGAASDIILQKEGGQVMIGDGTPNRKLSVNGGASKTGGSSWDVFSDMRLKQNIQPYTDGLASLLQIKPVWYQYTAASGFDSQTKYVGVLAQQLRQTSPYMVEESKVNKAPDGSGYLSVDNSAMTYMLINAVKEQQQQIEQLKLEIEKLKSTNK